MVEFKLYVEEKRLCRQDLNTCIVTGDANKIMQGGRGGWGLVQNNKILQSPQKSDMLLTKKTLNSGGVLKYAALLF